MTEDDQAPDTTEAEPSTPGPNPWAYGSGPLPRDEAALVAEIKSLAAARRQDARTHRPFCLCDGCRLRRKQQERFFRDAS